MSEVVDIPAPAAAQAAIVRFLARLEAELGKSGGEAVKWAAWYVARSLGASTRRAPKQLRLQSNPGDDEKFPRRLYPYFVQRYRNGEPWRRFVRYDADREKARRNPRAGLAAQSWLWSVADIGKTARTGSTLWRPPGAVEGTYRGGIDPTVTLRNRFRYIMAAVRLGGARGVETAMARGATAGLRYLDRRLGKALVS